MKNSIWSADHVVPVSADRSVGYPGPVVGPDLHPVCVGKLDWQEALLQDDRNIVLLLMTAYARKRLSSMFCIRLEKRKLFSRECVIGGETQGCCVNDASSLAQ